MPLPASGVLSMADIVAEFGGAAPHGISEYYGAASGIPASGQISIADFYGASSFDGPLLEYLGTWTSVSNNTVYSIPASIAARASNEALVLCAFWKSSTNTSTVAVSNFYANNTPAFGFSSLTGRVSQNAGNRAWMTQLFYMGSTAAITNLNMSFLSTCEYFAVTGYRLTDGTVTNRDTDTGVLGAGLSLTRDPDAAYLYCGHGGSLPASGPGFSSDVLLEIETGDWIHSGRGTDGDGSISISNTNTVAAAAAWNKAD